MDRTLGPRGRPPREAMRLLPLLSIFALTSLAACTLFSYLEGSTWLVAGSPELRGMWLTAALVFGAAAAAAGAMFAADAVRARRGGAFRIPPPAVLAIGLGLLVFGAVALPVQQGESYGQSPHGTGNAILIAYVAAALLLFALAFLGHRPSPRPLDRWARAVAAAHGLFGMGLGFLLAYIAVAPPSWVT